MKVHVFRGAKGVYGFTRDATGKNLPSQHGPWQYEKELDMNAGETPRAGVNTDDALADIDSNGYHLAKPEIKTT